MSEYRIVNRNGWCVELRKGERWLPTRHFKTNAAAQHWAETDEVIAERDGKRRWGTPVGGVLEVVRAYREAGLPLPPPWEPTGGYDEAALKAHLTRHVQGTTLPEYTLEEAQEAARHYMGFRYDGPTVPADDRDATYARAARRTMVRTDPKPRADQIVELIKEIERLKGIGTAPAIIAVKQKVLAKLQEEVTQV